MTQTEALRLALEALTNAYWPTDSDLLPAHNIKECGEAITAIKEALAQPEQLMSDQINYGMSVTQGGNRIDPMSIYKEREQDGECKHCTDGCPACDARKLPEQEPVGYASEGAAERLTTVKQAHEQIRSFKLFTHDVPLYTTAPQRPWVGLDDEDYIKALELCDFDKVAAFEFFETKLKEKNS
jgi:hypothetical protein